MHDVLGQKSDELAKRCIEQDQQQQQRRSDERKRKRKSSSDSSSSSSSSSSESRSRSPRRRRRRSPNIDERARLVRLTAELSNLKTQIQSELTAVEEQRNAAQAELQAERTRREQGDKRCVEILRIMSCLLYEFGADQKLLLSLAKMCKSKDITEIEKLAQKVCVDAL